MPHSALKETSGCGFLRLSGNSLPPSSMMMRLARGDRARMPAPSAAGSTSKVRCAVLWNTPSLPSASRAMKPLRRSSASIWTTGALPIWKLRINLKRDSPSGSRAMNHWLKPPLESPKISEIPPTSWPLAVISALPSSSSL
ncbi:hypothetical protein D3C76_1022690 [compost metagenome]